MNLPVVLDGIVVGMEKVRADLDFVDERKKFVFGDVDSFEDLFKSLEVCDLTVQPRVPKFERVLADDLFGNGLIKIDDSDCAVEVGDPAFAWSFILTHDDSPGSS